MIQKGASAHEIQHRKNVIYSWKLVDGIFIYVCGCFYLYHLLLIFELLAKSAGRKLDTFL